MDECAQPTIEQATTAEEIAAVRALFEEYAKWLAVDLCFQGFANELLTLPGLYAPPSGCLLLARVAGAPAGCVAVRPLERGACEMKRLFVRPAFRRRGLGRILGERAIKEAQTIGYSIMKLDTLPTMVPALELYKTLGFVPCSPYYDTPLKQTIFLERRLL
jgi:GNAT superfamily N-acetyltransferase